jgi:prepilin-type processing-associated H-X9-DG protein
VVIGIIALLIGILLPALSKARAQANSIKCMANLRTMGQAVAMYASAYNFYLPAGTTGNSTTDVPWYGALQQMLGRSGNVNQGSSAGSAGMLGEAFICPAHNLETSENQAQECDYSAHPRLMPRVNVSSDFDYAQLQRPVHHYMHQVKITQVPHTADTVLVADGAQVSAASGTSSTYALNSATECFVAIDNYYYWGVPSLAYPSPTAAVVPPAGNFLADQIIVQYQGDDINDTDAYQHNCIGQLSFRHQQSVNCLFVDGHVDSFHVTKKVPGEGMPNDAQVATYGGSTTASYKTDLLRKYIWVPYMP